MPDLQCQYCTGEGHCLVEKTPCTVRNNDANCYTYGRAKETPGIYDGREAIVHTNTYTGEVIKIDYIGRRNN